MNPIVVLLIHEESDTPAYMAVYLAQRGIDFVVFEFWKDSIEHLLPDSVDVPIRCVPVENDAHKYVPVPSTAAEGNFFSIRGVVSFGGSISVHDSLPHFEPILQLMRSCVATRTPVIGHCLGGQLLSIALGGSVRAAENIEVGWVDLQVENSAVDGVKNWFGGNRHISAFHIHTENFSIPPGATRVVTGKHCANQAFQFGDQFALGMQFHPEVDENKVKGMVAPPFPSLHTREEIEKMSPEEIEKISPAAMTRDEIDECLRGGRIEKNRHIADSIYNMWCSGFKC